MTPVSSAHPCHGVRSDVDLAHAPFAEFGGADEEPLLSDHTTLVFPARVTPLVRPRCNKPSMKIRIGIIGLPNVGKSTLFNALVKKSLAQAAKERLPGLRLRGDELICHNWMCEKVGQTCLCKLSMFLSRLHHLRHRCELAQHATNSSKMLTASQNS